MMMSTTGEGKIHRHVKIICGKCDECGKDILPGQVKVVLSPFDVKGAPSLHYECYVKAKNEGRVRE
jgi:hypothetical protein